MNIAFAVVVVALSRCKVLLSFYRCRLEGLRFSSSQGASGYKGTPIAVTEPSSDSGSDARFA